MPSTTRPAKSALQALPTPSGIFSTFHQTAEPTSISGILLETSDIGGERFRSLIEIVVREFDRMHAVSERMLQENLELREIISTTGQPFGNISPELPVVTPTRDGNPYSSPGADKLHARTHPVDIDGFTSIHFDESCVDADEDDTCETFSQENPTQAKRATTLSHKSHDASDVFVIQAPAHRRGMQKSLLPERICNMQFVMDAAPIAIILANAITMALSADIEQDAIIWDVLEGVWVFCYTVEFCVKVYLFGFAEYFFVYGYDKYWNWFDFTCLCLSLMDLCFTYFIKFVSPGGSAASLLKVVRLARLARLLRVLHYKAFAELKDMVLGVIAGMRVLMWAIVLLLLTIFILGLVMNTVAGDDVWEFRTVPHSMFTIFRCYTDGCTTYQGTPLGAGLFDRYGALFFLTYIFSFMIVSVGIFNLIMAIFIDQVAVSGLARRLEVIGTSNVVIAERLRERIVDLAIERVPALAARLTSANGATSMAQVAVSREVFAEWMEHPDMCALMEQADIEASTKMELFDVLDVDMGGHVSFDELIEGLMRLRGPITKSDIVACRLKVSYMTSMLEDLWQHTFIDEMVEKPECLPDGGFDGDGYDGTGGDMDPEASQYEKKAAQMQIDMSTIRMSMLEQRAKRQTVGRSKN